MQVWNKPLSYVHGHFPKYRLRQSLGLKEKNEDLNFLIHDGKMSPPVSLTKDMLQKR